LGGQGARDLRRFALAAFALFALAWVALALTLERFVNRVEHTALPEVSARAVELHHSIAVVDLHADALLFGRDLTRRSSVGHVDLPRLREGGVLLQVFGMATAAPLGMNIDRNEAPGLDTMRCCSACSSRAAASAVRPRGSRRRTRLSRRSSRAMRLIWVRSAGDLERLRAARERDPQMLGAMLGIEGAHALAGDPHPLDRAFARACA
jgi:microsomal dipeptidase-like Zn-dependent dipeptidase